MLRLFNKIFNKINYTIRERSIRNAHSKHRLEFSHEYMDLDKIINAFRNSGGLKHDFQAYKLWCLKQLLDKYRPHSILELGSGTSTVIFTNYVRENHGKLLSIDEDEKWARNTSNLIGLQNNNQINIQVCNKLFIDSIPPEIKYDINIKESFDLVFIDGPSLNVNGVKIREAVNSNVFDLPQKPKIIVVDVRKATAEHIASTYSKNYTIYLSDLLSGKPVRNDYNYFSLFIKND